MSLFRPPVVVLPVVEEDDGREEAGCEWEAEDSGCGRRAARWVRRETVRGLAGSWEVGRN